MKKKNSPKTPKPFELMKIELGIKVPPAEPRKNTLSSQMTSVLKKLPIGGSFLIKINQDSLVRKLLATVAEFKEYNVTIRQATEGKDYKRVYRLAKKDKK